MTSVKLNLVETSLKDLFKKSFENKDKHADFIKLSFCSAQHVFNSSYDLVLLDVLHLTSQLCFNCIPQVNGGFARIQKNKPVTTFL